MPGEAPGPTDEGIIDSVPGISKAPDIPMDPRLNETLTKDALGAILAGEDAGASAAELNQQYPAPLRPNAVSLPKSPARQIEPYVPTEIDRVTSPQELAEIRAKLRQEGKI